MTAPVLTYDAITMRHLVAVTTTVVPEAGPYRRPQLALYEIYQRVLETYGITCILITPGHSIRSLPRILDLCDGLVLTGGEDVNPAWYGEEPRPELGRVNQRRDRTEMVTLRLALERELPILGICRGCQLVNICLGGTLYQDLDTQRPGTLTHRQSDPWEQRTHYIDVVKDSLLHRIVRSDEMMINSFHHQGIKDLAPKLRVSARAEDGTIEAVEAPEYPSWFLGVQWHPERFEASAPETDPDRRIFNAFRHAIDERAGRQRPRGRAA